MNIIATINLSSYIFSRQNDLCFTFTFERPFSVVPELFWDRFSGNIQNFRDLTPSLICGPACDIQKWKTESEACRQCDIDLQQSFYPLKFE